VFTDCGVRSLRTLGWKLIDTLGPGCADDRQSRKRRCLRRLEISPKPQGPDFAHQPGGGDADAQLQVTKTKSGLTGQITC